MRLLHKNMFFFLSFLQREDKNRSYRSINSRAQDGLNDSREMNRFTFTRDISIVIVIIYTFCTVIISFYNNNVTRDYNEIV